MQSCITTGSAPDPIKPPSVNPPKTYYLTGAEQWGTMAEAKKALGSLAVQNKTKLDFNGNRISGKKMKHPSNSQSESSIPLKIDIDDLIFHDCIVEDIPGGVVVKGTNNTFSNCLFLDSGEDFISTQTSNTSARDKSGLKIYNCKFYNDGGGDKSVQANNADGLDIRDSFFTGGETAIRVQQSTDKKKVSASITDNTFENVPTAVNAAGNTTLTYRRNTFKNVNQQLTGGSSVKVIK